MLRTFLFAQLAVITALLIIHMIGFEYHLYWRFLWFDLIAHTLGGMWAGIFFLWMRSLFGYAPSVAWSIAGALVIGVLWEVFEIASGLPIEANYVFDTSIDLLMDAVGGALGILFALIVTKESKYLLKR